MSGGVEPGWYYAQGDPPGTVRYWNGGHWVGEARPGGTGPEAWAAFTEENQVIIASAGSRVGGAILDGFVWLVLSAAITLPVLFDFLSEAQETLLTTDGLAVDPETGQIDLEARQTELEARLEPFQQRLAVASVVSTGLIAAYEILTMVLLGGTIGKRLVGNRVVDVEGNRIGLGRAALRVVPLVGLQAFTGALLYFLNISIDLFWLVGLIGFVMLFADKRRQTPWDKLAGTLVVTR